MGNESRPRIGRTGTIVVWTVAILWFMVGAGTAWACEITQITPNSGPPGQILDVTLEGRGFGFVQVKSVEFGDLPVEILELPPTTPEPVPDSLRVQVNISPDTPPGPRDVVVTGVEFSCSMPGGFTVQEKAAKADLSVTKTASPSPVGSGQMITYTITVTNNGPDPATDVSLIEILPGIDQLSLELPFVTSQGTCSLPSGSFEQRVQCNLGNLPVGATATLTIRGVVLAKAGDTLSNLAVANGNEEDPNFENSSAQTETSVTEAPQENQPPVAEFTFSPSEPVVGKEITFDASASFDPDGEIVQYLWDFGDGTFGEGVTASHIYETPGSFRVTLTVIDDDGLTDTTERDLLIPPPEPPEPPLEQTCEVSVEGKFEPAQGVWQDDIIFADMPTKQLTTLGKNLYEAELKLVAGRPTLLFGPRETNHDKIHVDVTTTGSGSVILQTVIKLRDSKGERELARSPFKEIPCTTPGQVHHDFDINERNGIPAKYFTVAAGSYSIVIEVIGVGSAGPPKGTITVKGEAVTTHSPKVIFLPFSVNRARLTAAERTQLVQAAKDLNAASQKYIPDYYPLKLHDFASVANSSVWTLGNIVIKVPDSIKSSKITDFIRGKVNEAILAKIENDLFTTPRKFGANIRETRVVLVMPQDDFHTLEPDPKTVAVTFTSPHKVIFAQQNTPGSHWDVAHELAHSLPQTAGTLWIPEPACDKNYHNTGDKVGAGHRITLKGVENRERLDRVHHIMGSAAVPQWITQCTYWHLLNVLSGTIPDPELLVIRGYLLDMRSEGLGFNGWLLPALTDEGVPSDIPDEGDFFVIVRDGQGRELARRAFEPSFTFSDDTKVEITSINLAIPKPAGAAQIELHGPQGLMHTLSAGLNPPVVHIDSVDTAQGIVRWSAQDPDGDPLSFVLFASEDGQTWLPLEETEATSAEVDPQLLQGEGIQLMVIATDGINSSSDTVQAPFPEGGGEEAGGNTIEQALDANGNGLLDDDEIQTAIQLWIRGEPVPGTDGQIIDDAKIKELIRKWIRGEPLSGASSAQNQSLEGPEPLSVQGAHLRPTVDGFALEVQGQGIRRTRLEVFDLAGRRLLTEEAEGNRLRFAAVDEAGRLWANGVYLYLVTAYGERGQVRRSAVRKLMVLR